MPNPADLNPPKISQNLESTPFKRTPFKKMPDNEEEELKADSVQWHGEWVSAKKPFQTDSKVLTESFMVKSKNKTKSKFIPKSGKNNYQLEMNDIVGNYTAIKKDKDDRKYIDLQKKIEFHQEDSEEEVKSDVEP